MPKATTTTTVPTRILSIREPWASLIVGGYRPVEHRSWDTAFRGRLAIHAAKSIAESVFREWDDEDGDCHYQGMTGLSAKELRRLCRPGHVIGSVEVWGCIQAIDMHDFDTGECQLPPGYEVWVDDGWVWLLRNARCYVEPIPASGKLSLWKPDAALAGRIAAAEASAVACQFIMPKAEPWWMTADDDIDDDDDGSLPPGAFYPCAVCEGSGKYEGKTCQWCGGTGKDSSSP